MDECKPLGAGDDHDAWSPHRHRRAAGRLNPLMAAAHTPQPSGAASLGRSRSFRQGEVEGEVSSAPASAGHARCTPSLSPLNHPPLNHSCAAHSFPWQLRVHNSTP